jgi:hypothetical protein
MASCCFGLGTSLPTKYSYSALCEKKAKGAMGKWMPDEEKLRKSV